jgi:SAM-dependent methyltransferase
MTNSTHHHHHHDTDPLEWAAMIDHAELEGEVLISLLLETTARIAEQYERDGRAVGQVLDIGSGPGVGTCVLAERFSDATVIAVDASDAMLERVRSRAGREGLGDRVRTHRAELPDGLESVGGNDLVWAAMVLHHVGDEVAALRAIHGALNPDGLLAAVELGPTLRFVPDAIGLGRPGLNERLERAAPEWMKEMRSDLPGSMPSTDYSTMLEAAGFELLDHYPWSLRFEAPLDDRARGVALGHLRRMRKIFEPALDPEDLETLDVLIDEDDPRGVMHRTDAILEVSRQIYLARAVAR